MLACSFLRRLGTRTQLKSRGSIHSNGISSASSHFQTVASEPNSKYQIYLSKSDDPYLNLSIEHHLLQTTPADSTVLFLYSNRPCVVIGRNQNPWLEANLSTLTYPAAVGASYPLVPSTFAEPPESVELVRRRSGGGTVYHGPGNVNYSVICPLEQFTRDTHAEMVARALRTMNPTAMVNQRHDIVLEAGAYERLAEKDALPSEASPLDLSNANAAASMDPALKKVSGSAFKLTRSRALHHGTCLLCSPHLAQISSILSSPAASYLRARGVDSVRSPVANVLPPATNIFRLRENVRRFQDAVLRAFAEMYPAASLSLPDIHAILDTASKAERSHDNPEGAGAAHDPTVLTLHQNTVSGVLGLELATLPSIKQGMTELRSNEWLFGQTPRFTLSTHTSARESPDPTEGTSHRRSNIYGGYGIFVATRAATITGASYIAPMNEASTTELLDRAESESNQLDPERGSLGAALRGTELWRPRNWDHLTLDTKLPGHDNSTGTEATEIRNMTAEWLEKMLPLPQLNQSSTP